MRREVEMIAVELSKPDFEYDIRGMIREFYPKEEVRIYYKDDEASINEVCEEDNSGKVKFQLFICYEDNRITCLCKEDGKEIKLETAIDQQDRKETKKQLKRMLYRHLVEQTGQLQLWGTLTGIRPVKIVLSKLQHGESIEQARKCLIEDYYVAESKVELCLEIAAYEQQLLTKTAGENGYSLYIHIPFCPSTCLYCSFTSNDITKWKNKITEYLDALEKELHFVSTAMKGAILDTVYIGGGTPTTLEPDQLERLFFVLEDLFSMDKVLEFTVEAGRPDSITKEKLMVMKKHKVSRISINPQTMNQKTLDLIGRFHRVEEIRSAYKVARDCGFSCINMDIIVGLPGETMEDLIYTLQEIELLNPDNLTVHSLAIKRTSRLKLLMEDYENLPMENSQKRMELVDEAARRMGMKPYYLYRQKNMAGNLENVGYARAGKEGLYNILIMEEQETIMAVGAGASTKLVVKTGDIVKRVENVKDVAQYLTRVEEMNERKRQAIKENFIKTVK